MDIDRHWFITVGTYGTRLPGDERGFVGYHWPNAVSRQRLNCNIPRTPLAADMPALARHAVSIMTGPPIHLSIRQAMGLLSQFQETSMYRGWQLLAVAIMADHFHVVVGVPGDPEPGEIRGDLKSYGSRRLNRSWGQPSNGTWWAEGGSNRKLPTDESVLAAIQYTIDQEHPLVIWTAPIPELNLPGGIMAWRPR